MRSKKNVETIRLEEGESLQREFDNYFDMAVSAVDWTLFCTYQLKPDFTEGVHRILQLPSMQIAYTHMSGGVMFDYVAPEGCLTFSFMKRISHKACIDQMKLETGMVTVTDDKKIYNFSCSSEVELLDVSLNRSADPRLREKLLQATDHFFWDPGMKLTRMIMDITNEFAESGSVDPDTSAGIERRITAAMLRLFDEQKACTPYFTRSEKVALEIKKKIIKHMDHTLSIEALASEYRISMKSMQNAFRSLYDLTPKQFLRLLKLNLAHHELMQADPRETSVSRVAQKWGFGHMGRFAQYYLELFGEKPSGTLRNTMFVTDGMKEHCVERQEEIF